MRRIGLLLLLGALGCGGASTSAEDARTPEERARDAELDRADRRRQAIADAEPESPYDVRSVRAFRPDQPCGQGPYRIRSEALGARYGEQLDVYACVSRDIAGRYRLTSEDERWVGDDGRAFGFRQDNERCRATDAELVTRGGAGEGASSSGAARSGTGPAAPETSPAPEREPAEMREVAAFEECPEGQYRVSIMHRRGFQSSSGSPLEAGAGLVVEIWSTVPNDMDGLTFVVRQLGVDEQMTQEAWHEYQRLWSQWYERYRAFVDGEVEAGRSHWVEAVDTGEHGPPPAPRAETRPPRSSRNAEWIPGYWHHESEWAWVAGWWRVPRSDVEADLTVHAPVAPPPPRQETQAQQSKPATDAVWSTGHWQWNGDSFVWVPGAWRLPPSAGHRWRAPTWRAGRSGSVFVPGGWTIRVGL